MVHIPLIHVLAIGLTWLKYGAAAFLFLPPPTLGTPKNVLLVLYPLCLWFARLKQRKRAWWLSYL